MFAAVIKEYEKGQIIQLSIVLLPTETKDRNLIAKGPKTTKEF